ncbi:MAG: M15 family metallopeptidase [Lachnospiraceae bacterium]|nr:M15 family metallopeptidase [Lachnospiraceae bacterium]
MEKRGEKFGVLCPVFQEKGGGSIWVSEQVCGVQAKEILGDQEIGEALGNAQSGTDDRDSVSKEAAEEKSRLERLVCETRAGETLEEAILTPELVSRLFYSEEISDDVRQRIWGRSYQENDQISLEDLRYLRVLHRGFDGAVHVGELMVHRQIADDVLEIMQQLYENDYPIEKMVLVDEYGGSDEASMEDNNTSAFNFRMIAGTNKMSNHSMGLAIDVNPRYNPYVKEKSSGELLVSPENGRTYVERSKDIPYEIQEGDLCLELFLEHGFTWGGNWNGVKDYQHFEKAFE